MKIEVVSDNACPWCAVGVYSLDRALAALGDSCEIELSFQPFELNPDMPPEGEDLVAHLSAKYGIDASQETITLLPSAQRSSSGSVQAFARYPRSW